MTKIMKSEVDPQIILKHSRHKLNTVSCKHFAVYLDINKISDFNQLFLVAFKSLGKEISFVAVSVQPSAFFLHGFQVFKIITKASEYIVLIKFRLPAGIHLQIKRLIIFLS